MTCLVAGGDKQPAATRYLPWYLRWLPYNISSKVRKHSITTPTKPAWLAKLVKVLTPLPRKGFEPGSWQILTTF